MLRLNCGPPLAAGFLIIRWLRDVLPDAPGLLLGRAKAFRVPFSVCFRPFTPPGCRCGTHGDTSGRWALASTTQYVTA